MITASKMFLTQTTNLKEPTGVCLIKINKSIVPLKINIKKVDPYELILKLLHKKRHYLYPFVA